MKLFRTLLAALMLWPTLAFAAVVSVTPGDEADLRSKVAAGAEGDVINVPPGTYALTATCTITTGVKIRGSGAAGATAGPTTVTVSSNFSAFTIDNSAATVTGLEISNLKIVGSGGSTLDGIAFAGSSGKKLAQTIFERLGISGFNNGINLAAFDGGAGAMVHLTIQDCNITTNRTRGIVVTNASIGRIERCEVNASGANGVFVNLCPTFVLRSCAVEGNNTANNQGEGGAQLLLKLTHQFSVSGLDIEGASLFGVVISNCLGGTLGSTNIIGGGVYGLRMTNASKDVAITSLYISGYRENISAAPGAELPIYDPRTVISL